MTDTSRKPNEVTLTLLSQSSSSTIYLAERRGKRYRVSVYPGLASIYITSADTGRAITGYNAKGIETDVRAALEQLKGSA